MTHTELLNAELKRLHDQLYICVQSPETQDRILTILENLHKYSFTSICYIPSGSDIKLNE